MKPVRPRRLLAPVNKRISDFAHLLGAEMYADWSKEDLARLGSSDALSSANVVATQIISALAQNRIRAAVAVSYSSVIESGIDNSTHIWNVGHYFIAPMYWDIYKDRYMDWTNSKAIIGASSLGLLDERSSGNYFFQSLTSIYGKPLDREYLFKGCIVYIDDAYQALASLHSYPQIPTSKDLARYDVFKKKLFLELTIVAWRFLAIEKPEDYNGYHSRIVKAMRAYLEDAGIYEESENGVSERSLTNLATKIMEQLKRRNNLEGALLNASPDALPKKLIPDDRY